MFDTTADALEDWHYSRLDADMEQAEMERVGREREADRKVGNCWHDGGFGFRPVAFYPEQVGLTQGQMFCADCRTVQAEMNGPDCMVCDLDRFNCMATRGCAPERGKYAHAAFVLPPMIMKSVAPSEGF